MLAALEPYHHHHYHHVPDLLQTSAIMAFQSSQSSVLLMRSLLTDSFLVTKLFRIAVYIVRCLPLLLVPQIFPLNICFSSPSALFICPKNAAVILWLFWVGTFCNFTPWYASYFSYVPHFCCFKSSFYVFCQCPAFTSMQKDGPYVGFQSVDFGVNSYISVGEEGLLLGEFVFRQSYSFLYFCVAPGIWSYSKAQAFKGSICFILSPLERMSHTGMSDCFEMTMHSVVFAFSWSPLFSLSTMAVVRMSCSFSSKSAIKTVSTAYLRLFILLPPTLVPSY